MSSYYISIILLFFSPSHSSQQPSPSLHKPSQCTSCFHSSSCRRIPWRLLLLQNGVTIYRFLIKLFHLSNRSCTWTLSEHHISYTHSGLDKRVLSWVNLFLQIRLEFIHFLPHLFHLLILITLIKGLSCWGLLNFSPTFLLFSLVNLYAPLPTILQTRL